MDIQGRNDFMIYIQVLRRHKVFSMYISIVPKVLITVLFQLETQEKYYMFSKVIVPYNFSSTNQSIC